MMGIEVEESQGGEEKRGGSGYNCDSSTVFVSIEIRNFSYKWCLLTMIILLMMYH